MEKDRTSKLIINFDVEFVSMEKDCTSKLIINFGVEFFFREKDRTSKLIIKMQGQMTSIYNPETPSKKNYLFLHRYILYFNALSGLQH
jgi:hypothetical protein